MNSWLAAGATAAVMSERTRGMLRRGTVYGLAGMLTVGDALLGAARGIADGAESVASAAGGQAGDVISEARTVRSGSRGGSARSRNGSRRRTAATKDELYEEAKARGIEGRSEMSKEELLDALRR